jgi:uncharacterized protein YdbL (DUF1318 family)
MKTRTFAFAAAAVAVLAFSGAAHALEDPVLNAALDQGAIGEQADGYLGVVDGATVSADARARLNQVNLRRREVYVSRAQQTGVTPDEFARVTACKLLVQNTPAGGRWRDGVGSWRATPVSLPAYCPAP